MPVTVKDIVFVVEEITAELSVAHWLRLSDLETRPGVLR